MDRVVVGVRRQGQSLETDIEVPTDLSAAELAERLAKAVGEPGGDGPLELRAVSLGRALRPGETLADAGLWDGAMLVLSRASDPIELGSRGGGALALADAPSRQLVVIPIPEPPELGLALFEPSPRPILPLALAAVVAIAVVTAGAMWFFRGRQEAPAASAVAPTSVPAGVTQAPENAPTQATPGAVVSNATSMAAQPQAAPDEEAAWRSLLAQLDSVWGADWPASITLLQAFHSQYPTRTAATDKLYSALVEYGRALREAGATSAAADAFDQAVRLQPQRFEARDELASMAPAPTALAEPPPPTLPPPATPTLRTVQVAPPVEPPPPERPPVEEPGVTCDLLNRDVACPLSDGARLDTSIAVPGGRHFYWFGVTSSGTQLHVEASGAACTCALYLFSDDVDSGNTPIASATNTLDLGVSRPGPYLLEIVPDQSGGPSDERYVLSFALRVPLAEEAIATEPAVQTAPTESPATVAVPPVVARSTGNAADQVRAAGLVPQFQTAHVYSPGGAGTVAAQDPPAGSVLQVGSPVTLLVASGNVAVPVVVGLAEQDALAALKQSGFDVVTRRARRSNVAAGQASSTDPPAGAIVPEGTTVTLTISQGP